MTKRNSLFSRLQPLPDIAVVFAANLAVFFAARLAMLHFLWPSIVERGDVAKALYIGLKFDCRYAVFLSLPLALLLLVPPLERRVSAPRSWLRRGLCLLQSLLFGVAVMIHILDFGFFFYLQERLDMTAAGFLEDPLISASMLWQSYPVIWLSLGYMALVAGYGLLLGRFLRRHRSVPVLSRRRAEPGQPSVSPPVRAGLTLLILVGLFGLAYGQVSSNLFPLRWSNAYFSADKNITLLALNPIQNLYDTRRAGQVLPPDLEAAKAAWPRMASWLGIAPHARELSFVRHFPAPAAAAGIEARPNVVIIIMESLAWPRTSFAPAPPAAADAPDALDATPFLRELAEKSRYYSNFYAPARTTARAIFTTISGIPDVNHAGGTTSRNPILVDQSTVLNEFGGYEKYYLIGGSASWANIRGLLQYNVTGLHLLEEGAWEAPNVDVWGISDLALFRESAGVFSRSAKPFIGVIQTAGFHRPYTIPDDNEGYVPPPPASEAALRHYGFESEKEYVSMHFSDHALRRFFEHAKSQPWFDNTIFAIFGDHGLTYRSENVSPGYLSCGLQAWHIPLLLYAPGRVAPGVNDHPYTQPDVLVTLARLAGLDFRSNTLGRDMLDPANDRDAAAFISASDHHRYLVRDGYCFGEGNGDVLYDLASPVLENLVHADPERALGMKRELADFFHTSKYLLHNNAKALLSGN